MNAVTKELGKRDSMNGDDLWVGSTIRWNHFAWKPAGHNDLRSPCPAMNTLANHGFLPRDGRHITKDILITALKDGYNIGYDFAFNIWDTGRVVNPQPNATFFDMDMLQPTHGLVEHDGSLSRADVYFDTSGKFDPKVFDSFMSYFGNDTEISVKSLANARARHALDMSRVNPDFAIAEESVPVLVGENAMLVAIWGDPVVQVIDRAYFEYFFRNERMPVELGWSPPSTEIGPTIGQIVNDMIAQSPADVPLSF
ncbi:hypothetical protein PFICI_12706 [Pestalotiopsis fici W106-1]|uniref:Heme haloperoxidase family profile domain-containing protein n=1 Tax=Pestalotiopsis fici (strain W106-1 / CGMCC3.15140) TaxID=1229662 RepID=W3WRL0_PESFW|nr:uncharacterized protein PFICI_12706 [Pestalotiopsis fici W106-1]ETS75762.1 hypothetical protein PFICI_12706 [Pestalotiopsis fici W106-1]